MTKKRHILFMGTTDFAANVLLTLLQAENYEIIGVVCQPDRLLNRKKEVTLGQVKQLALKNNILCYQPEKINSLFTTISNLEIDFIVTCAYGQFLPQSILKLAKIEAINIHASLLPKLRGGAPIHWAIINNYHETGISIIKMIKKMDAGEILMQKKIIINHDETYQSLKKKLATLAQTMIISCLDKIMNNSLELLPQCENNVTFGLNITKENEMINWQQTAELVSCQVRGLYDNPVAYTQINNFKYKIHKISVTNQKSQNAAGTITNINKHGIFVSTLDFDVVIKIIQPESKNAISAASYFGNKENSLKIGTVFLSGTLNVSA